MVRARSPEDVFRLYVVPTGFCWYWTGTVSRGYGVLKRDGRTQSAHRWVYEHLVVEVPRGTSMDHLCRNTLCVNPDHLQAVTVGENTRRGARSWSLTGKCRSGRHDISNKQNVLTHKNGKRQCRPCYNEYQRETWRSRDVG